MEENLHPATYEKPQPMKAPILEIVLCTTFLIVTFLCAIGIWFYRQRKLRKVIHENEFWKRDPSMMDSTFTDDSTDGSGRNRLPGRRASFTYEETSLFESDFDDNSPTAIVLANWEYEYESQFRPLVSPKSDWKEMCLLSKRFGWNLFQRTNLMGWEIVELFQTIRDSISHGPIIMYYSGHGTFDSRIPKYSQIVGVDGSLVNFNKWFIYQESMLHLNKIVILDMCRVAHKGSFRDDEELFFPAAMKGSVLYAFAARLGDPTYSSFSGDCSPLTNRIVNACFTTDLEDSYDSNFSRVIQNAAGKQGEFVQHGGFFNFWVNDGMDKTSSLFDMKKQVSARSPFGSKSMPIITLPSNLSKKDSGSRIASSFSLYE